MNIYSDEGISGAKVDEEALEVDRIGFQSMLAALSTQTIDAVIVLNTSCLWRSDIVKVLVHREFKKHGVDVRSIEQPTYSIYKKDPNDFLINGLMELLDQYQSVGAEELAAYLRKASHNTCSTRNAEEILELVKKMGRQSGTTKHQETSL